MSRPRHGQKLSSHDYFPNVLIRLKVVDFADIIKITIMLLARNYENYKLCIKMQSIYVSYICIRCIFAKFHHCRISVANFREGDLSLVVQKMFGCTEKKKD